MWGNRAHGLTGEGETWPLLRRARPDYQWPISPFREHRRLMQPPRWLGGPRGGLTTRIHLRWRARRLPTVNLTGGNVTNTAERKSTPARRLCTLGLAQTAVALANQPDRRRMATAHNRTMALLAIPRLEPSRNPQLIQVNRVPIAIYIYSDLSIGCLRPVLTDYAIPVIVIRNYKVPPL